MARFGMHDIKQQASLFFRERVNNARLAFTDVSRIQLLTEEATNADPWGPETKTMRALSTAAFDREEYERIVQVLRDRLAPNNKRPWRQLHKTLVVIEYLLTHGPKSLSSEFRSDLSCIEELSQYSMTDQQGVDRGHSIRQKADKVLELLMNSDAIMEERNRAIKITHGIHGFGSSKYETSSGAQSSESGDTQPDMLESESSVRISGDRSERPANDSLLGDGISEEKSHEDVESEWQPFEKCASLPPHFMHSAETQESNNDKVSQQGSLSKKTQSDPAHLRDTANWQEFADESSGMSDEEISGSLLSKGPVSNGVVGEGMLRERRSLRQKLKLSMFSKELQPKEASECMPIMPKNNNTEFHLLSKHRPHFRSLFQHHQQPVSLVD